MNLFRLSSLVGDDALRERGRRTIAVRARALGETPHAMPQLLCAFESALEPPRHVVLTGDPASPAFAALATVAQERLGPRRTLIALDGGPGRPGLVRRPIPLARTMGKREPGPTAYVCEEFTCRAPARTPAELRKVLGHPGPAG